MALEAALNQMIEDGKWSFHCSSTMADDLTRKQYPGHPWEQFPDREGTLEGVSISQDDPLRSYGTVYVSNLTGKLVAEDETARGGGHTLSEVPQPIFEAVRTALQTDKSIEGPHVRELKKVANRGYMEIEFSNNPPK